MKKLEVDIFEGDLPANAHAILGAFKKQAHREGWSDAEINEVLEEAKAGTYDELIQALMRHTE